LIDDGQTGVLFKTESKDSLVEQAVRLAGQPDLRRHVADNAHRFIERERTWDRIVARYLPAYRGAA
jgi:glycosyltransferase involved in cell wall biosynthesis